MCSSDLVVWRRKLDNDWVRRAELVVDKYLDHPEESDEPTCGPGPFSMASADTTSDILMQAGFEDISLLRCDLPLLMGRDVDEAIDIVMELGPGGEILRLWGDRMAHLHEQVRDALREGLTEFKGPDGIYGNASTWIVSARAPAG